MPIIYPGNNDAQSQKEEKNLDNLVQSTSHVLARCSSIFPFTLFPDTITLDQNKIDIVYHNFFFTKYVFTILIKDIKTVKVSTDPFFATIHFEVEGYEENPAPVKFLSKSCALRIHDLIMGLTTAKREGIHVSGLDEKMVAEKVKEIGSVQEKLTGI